MECLSAILGLLSHENADISVAVVDLLQELTDIDTLNESEEGTAALINALAAQQICALLGMVKNKISKATIFGHKHLKQMYIY